MKKSIAAFVLAVALPACAPQPSVVVYEAPQAASSKRIAVLGNTVTLPDGSQATMDTSGGFDLPNGDRVTRDARGALLLPNGNRCLPDRGGFVCP